MHLCTGKSIRSREGGFTLIELVLVIVITGILVGVALQSGKQIAETGRVEETRAEMDQLAYAIVGNPALVENGSRTDFGYVGDVGTLPPNLDALASNPGGLATWKGPYVSNRFEQIAGDYRTDAWGGTYVYGGVSITSSGSGTTIVRTLAGSPDQLLYNPVSGTIVDRDGTPPGPVYRDSVVVSLTFPDGSGALRTVSVIPDIGGLFAFDSVPIGRHNLNIVYTPSADSLSRYVAVSENSDAYSLYRFTDNLWDVAAGGSLVHVPNSDTSYSAPQCNHFSFWIENNTGAPITISSITLTWSSPVAYYKEVRWNGATVANLPNPSPGSGDLAIFSTPQAINDGEQVQISVVQFKSNPGGGTNVNMENTSFAVELSDGSTFQVELGPCQ